MSALPDLNTRQFGARSRIDVLHVVVALILSALPAAAAAAFPPGALEDTNQTFVTLYLVTLPWSLAVSAITAGFAGGWFGSDDKTRILAVAGILVVSAVIGGAIAPGSSVDEHFTGGSPVLVASEAMVFCFIGYALVYGWPMWFASFFLAAYVGWWVHEKRLREDVADVASTPALTGRVVQPSPSARPAGVAIAARTSTLGPPMTKEPPRRPRYDELGGLTKAELYERAREIGLKGRSAMSKAQLLAALRGDR